MKSLKFTMLAVMAALTMSLTGCIKPVEPKVLVDAGANETMFIVPLVGDTKEQAKLNSKEYYDQKKVSVKQFQIPHRWLQVGRMETDGRWIPSVSVIKVDRTPITTEFAVNDKDNAKKDADAIWVESADSVGFTTGFSVSAMVAEEDTSTFLYRYQAATLRTILSTEVRARIQQQAALFAGKYPLDGLRSKKNEMQTFITTDVIPFFKERGITITTIAQFGGMTYENPQIQLAIDKVFVAQQEKETAAAALAAVADINKRTNDLAVQDKTNAITLATGKAEAVRLEAEAVAKGNLLKAQADASGIEAVSKATQIASSNPLFLEVRKLDVQTKMYEKWAGQVPSTVIASSGVTPNIFLPNSPSSTTAAVATK
jgi:hypothetical protein